MSMIGSYPKAEVLAGPARRGAGPLPRNWRWWPRPGNRASRSASSPGGAACRPTSFGRDWYEITSWALQDVARCRPCGTRCAGVFEAQPGSWGARRLTVEVGGYFLSHER